MIFGHPTEKFGIKIKIVSVRKFGILATSMKVLLIVGVILASAASLWAQGQIVAGSEALQRYVNPNPISAYALLVSSPPTPSDWLPPSQRSSSASDNVSFAEISCELIMYEAPAIPVLTPTPTADSSSSFVPDVQSQSLVIQPVPEPSAFALGGLSFGLLTAMRVIRKIRPAGLN